MSIVGFAGSGEVISRLDSMLASDRLPHAIIIEGPVGSGRRTLARLIARAAACTGDGDVPCGICPSCRAGLSPDVTVVTSDKAVITVDTVRTIRSDAYIVPTQSKKRVFIIPDAQQMNAQAQNVLLKVLEEPPASAMFILTCEYTRQLLATVVSRAAVLSLTLPDTDEAVGYITARYPEYAPDQVRSALRGATIGEALRRLGGEGGYMAEAEKLSRLVCGSETDLHAAMKGYERDRTAQKGIADAMCSVMHDALGIRCGASRQTADDDVRRYLAARLTAQQLLRLCDVCRTASSDCDANMGGILFITFFCASLIAAVQE